VQVVLGGESCQELWTRGRAIPGPSEGGQPTNNLEPGKNQRRCFCLFFSRRPRWSRPCPQTAADMFVSCAGSWRQNHATRSPPPGRLGRLPHATGVKENQRDGIPDGSWNPKRWVKVTKRRTGVPLADLHSAPAGGCRKWTLTALAARQLDWHGAWKEARGNFPAFPPGVRGPCAVPASRRCQRRVIGWPPSFCWAKAAGSRRATCLFTPLSRQKGREKNLSFATCFLAVVRRRASVASNQAFAKTGDRRLQAMAESQT
jgi:hypothetical protein